MSPQPSAGGSKPSCMDCPALLIEGGQQASLLQKYVGAPVCSYFGHVVGQKGNTDAERQKIGEVYAKGCSKFGEAPPGSAPWSNLSLKVALPSPEAIVDDDKLVDPDLVSSCRMCANFIREEDVALNSGYYAGVCAAKGKLILPSRLTREAKDCSFRTYGATAASARNLIMLPEYTVATAGNADPVRNHAINRSRAFVDPADYPSDKPVTDEDMKSGIRAWRLIFDPDSRNEVYLPVFNRDFFPPEEQMLIPSTGDDEHPEDYVDHAFYTYKMAVLWQELDVTPGVWGMPGVGKTEVFRHLAWLMQLPFYRFSITARTELEDLAGKMLFKEGETRYQVGRFVHAWSSPCVIVVDEPNAGPDEVWHFFRAPLDNSRQLVLDQDDGTKYPRHDSCYIGFAMNPSWDIRNSGVKDIADADIRRLHHMYFDLPPKEIERDIITKKVYRDGRELPVAKLDTLMKIAEDVRDQSKSGTLPISWGIAMQIKVARLLAFFDWKTAFRMAAGDSLEPQTLEVLLDVVKSYTEGRATAPSPF